MFKNLNDKQKKTICIIGAITFILLNIIFSKIYIYLAMDKAIYDYSHGSGDRYNQETKQ